MKHLILIALLLTSYVVSFAQTKLIIDRKDGTKDSIAVNAISQISFSSSGIYQPSLLGVSQILDSTQIKFIGFAKQTIGDPWLAIALTTAWLNTQPFVQSALTYDSVFINIKLKSGLKTVFSFNQTDDRGYSVYRGGGGPQASGAHLTVMGKKSKNTITNKKVLIFSPVTREFYGAGEIEKIIDLFNKSEVKFDVTLVKDNQCTLQVVDGFKDYGLVILDTHGGFAPFWFQGGTVIDVSATPKSEEALKAAADAQAGAGSYLKLMSGDIMMGMSLKINPNALNWQTAVAPVKYYTIHVNPDYINKLPLMPNTVIFANCCWGGHTHTKEVFGVVESPIQPVFTGRNPITYFSYSDSAGNGASMSNDFCKAMEDSLVRSLVKDLDSTKMEHLTKYWDKNIMPPEGRVKRRVFFKNFGADDYSYGECITSFTDERDGHVYKAVCIGKQNWMAENLNYNAPGSITYDNNPANGNIYGRLYGFQAMMQGAPPSNANPSGVQGVCPKGWHVPSDEEFSELFGTVGDQGGGKLKSVSSLWNSPNLDATNSSGFSALPGGFSSDISKPDYFLNLGYSAIFGTTTVTGNIWQGWGILADSNTLDGFGEDPQKSGVSCRCVKD